MNVPRRRGSGGVEDRLPRSALVAKGIFDSGRASRSRSPGLAKQDKSDVLLDPADAPAVAADFRQNGE
jgi:hypothetical protein